MEIPKWIPKKIREAAEKLGGLDVDDSEDLEERLSCDKGSHRERSLQNQPNHLVFWRKHKEENETEQGV